VIDLSRAAAEDLGMLHQGIAPVHLEVLQEYPHAKGATPLQALNELNDVQLASGY
jgi:rare lipoprotein A (peptidoglycan hydrolase)